MLMMRWKNMPVAGVEQRATVLLAIHWQENPDDGR
jgi:hypothetical protein